MVYGMVIGEVYLSFLPGVFFFFRLLPDSLFTFLFSQKLFVPARMAIIRTFPGNGDIMLPVNTKELP